MTLAGPKTETLMADCTSHAPAAQATPSIVVLEHPELPALGTPAHYSRWAWVKPFRKIRSCTTSLDRFAAAWFSSVDRHRIRAASRFFLGINSVLAKIVTAYLFSFVCLENTAVHQPEPCSEPRKGQPVTSVEDQTKNG